MITSRFSNGKISSVSEEAYSLYSKSRIGEKKENKVEYTFYEAIYLMDKKKMEMFLGSKKIKSEELVKKLGRYEKRLEIKYAVFSDLRSKGYLVKSAFKFGADFRVYEKGVKPGEEHALWILECFRENEKITWKEFAAKNRIAHSTKKRLLIAVVDGEGDVSYYQCDWLRT